MINPFNQPRVKRNLGFTLLEVLIALVVLSIGLLGLAGLQLTSLQASNDSYGRTQATILAYDIADRMRANVPAAINGNYIISPGTPPAAPAVDCTATSCTTAQMAQDDTFDWFQQVTTANVLPGGTARITCDDLDDNDDGDSIAAGAFDPDDDNRPGTDDMGAGGTDGDQCTAGSAHSVTVMWDEARTGATGTGCTADTTVDRTCFSLEFTL